MIQFRSFTCSPQATSSCLLFAVFSLFFLIASLVILPSAGIVLGHAFVLDSEPPRSGSLEEPPARVEVFLSEPVDERYSEVKVIGPNGNQIDNKDTQHFEEDQSTLVVTLPDEGLENGVYTVSTKMLSQIDGHVTDDAFVFGIGEGTSVSSSTSGQTDLDSAAGPSFDQLSLPDAIARFPALVGQVVVLGAAFASLWLWKPFNRLTMFNNSVRKEELGHGKKKQNRTLLGLVFDEATQFRESIDQRLVKIMLVGASIVLVADFGMIYALAYSLNIGMVDAMTTKFGNIWFVRTAISFLLLALTLIVYVKAKKKRSSRISETKATSAGYVTNPIPNSAIVSTKLLLSILMVGVLTLLTTSLMGHGAAITSGSQIPITIDFVHNLAASIWIGGVIYLALAAVPMLKNDLKLEERIKCSILSIMIPRFSTLPIVVLGIIVITGPFLLYLLEDDLNLTLASLYGKALLAKLILAAIMVAIGGYNQRIIHSRALNVLQTSQMKGKEQQVVISSSKDSKRLRTSSTSISTNLHTNDREGTRLPNRLVRLMHTIRENITGGKNKNTRDQIARGYDYHDNKKKFGQPDYNDSIDYHDDIHGSPGKNTKGFDCTKHRSERNVAITWQKTISSFSRSIRTEAILGILLLVAVAMLTNTGLPASEFQAQLQQAEEVASQTDIENLLITTSGATNGIAAQGSTGGAGYSATQYLDNATARIKLTIEPFSVGNNNFEIEFLDPSGNPIDMRTVDLKLTQTDENIGPIDIQTNKASGGLFTANASFGLAGPWDLLIEGVRNEANSLNLVAAFNLFVKPDLDQIDYRVTQVAMPDNRSQPLYPVYDSSRNSIWVGDTALASGRILEYNNANNQYHEHKINGTNIITTMALDQSNDRIWFIDPISKVLGVYDPQANSSKLYSFPNDRIVPSSVAFRSAEFPFVNPNNNSLGDASTSISAGEPGLNETTSGNVIGGEDVAEQFGDSPETVWITSPSTGEVLIFDTTVENFTNSVPLPTSNSNPLGIAIDSTNGQVWVAEGVGKIAHIDPSVNFTVNEFSPTVSGNGSGIRAGTGAAETENDTLISPTALLIDPYTRNIYITEHDGHIVSLFNPLFRTFTDFPPMAEDSLPFGMALDNDRNLWVAEHVTNRLTVIDPMSGKSKEVTLPSATPFVQYLTTDNEGKIWFAAQRGNAIGYITPTVNLLQSPSPASSPSASLSAGGQDQGAVTNNTVLSFPEEQTFFTPLFNIGYEYLLGPLIAMSIFASAVFYVKVVFSVKTSIMQVNRLNAVSATGNRSPSSKYIPSQGKK